MSHHLEPIAFECETHIIKKDDFYKYDGKVPLEIQKYIDLINSNDMNAFLNKYGGPTAISLHPKYGWVVLGCGQGPFIMWSEKEID